jgi:hypothetical protein
MQVENILEICQAYESGINAGRLKFSADNNEYEKETDLFYAWALGHNMGIRTELIDLSEGWIN